MNKLTPNIQEVMVFLNWLSVRQNLQKLLSLEYVLYSPVSTIKTNISRAQTFFANFQACITGYKEHFIFWECGLILFHLILKNRQLSLMVHTSQKLEAFKFNSRFENSTTLRVS
jgi:hypothetical protein